MKKTLHLSAAMSVLALAFAAKAQAQDALFIDSKGHVGIGTLTPDYNLTIANFTRDGVIHNHALAVDNNAVFAARNTGGAYERFLWPRNSDNKMVLHYGSNGLDICSNGGAKVMVIDGNNNVGIGTTEPRNKLQLGGAMHMAGNPIYFKGDPGDKNAMIKWVDGDRVAMGGWNGVVLGNTRPNNGTITPALTVNGEGSVNMTGSLDVAGHVGITNNLDVVGDIYTKINGDVGSRRIGMHTSEFTGMEIRQRPVNTQLNAGGRGGIIQFYTWGFYHKYSDPSVTISEGGNMGIGTQTPKAKLEIVGSVKYNTGNGFFFMKNGQADQCRNCVQDRDASIMADRDICTKDHFVAYSDARIKKDLRHSNPAADLVTLNKLKVTDYRYVDSFAYGTESVKGLIAQDVEKVYPEAVSTGQDFVPDVFAAPKSMTRKGDKVTFVMAKPHHLVKGNIVKLVTTTGNKEMEVVAANGNTFTIADSANDYKETFVFGKQVADFRKVDYDRVFTLNLSATQELSKQVDALKAEVTALKQQNTELMNSMMSRLQALELAGKTAKK